MYFIQQGHIKLIEATVKTSITFLMSTLNAVSFIYLSNNLEKVHILSVLSVFAKATVKIDTRISIQLSSV